MNTHKTAWDRTLGTSKRAQGVVTRKRPKTPAQRRAAAHAAAQQSALKVGKR